MKNLLLYSILLLIFLSNSCTKPDGKLSGVVTYYFNSNYGDKEDVGANVYIINKSDIDTSIANLIAKYCDEKYWYDSYQNYLKEISTYSTDLQNNLVEQKIYSSNSLNILIKAERETLKSDSSILEIDKDELEKMNPAFSILQDSASNNFLKFQSRPKTNHFETDGSGKYTVSLSPGKYYILIQSNHRQDEEGAESTGKIKFQVVTIESGKESTANANFGI